MDHLLNKNSGTILVVEDDVASSDECGDGLDTWIESGFIDTNETDGFDDPMEIALHHDVESQHDRYIYEESKREVQRLENRTQNAKKTDDEESMGSLQDFIVDDDDESIESLANYRADDETSIKREISTKKR